MAARAQKARALSAPADLDEEAALGAAINAYEHGFGSPRERVQDVISAWIVERSRRITTGRLTDDTTFALGDAQLRGIIEACLPAIGDGLAGIPPDVPLFELSQAQIVDVFLVACATIREAALRVNERPTRVLDDEIPF